MLFGDLQLVPVASGLMYAWLVYVEIDNVAEYRFVIVSYNDRVAMACDLGTALDDLFNGFTATVGDRIDGDTLVRPGVCLDQEQDLGSQPQPDDGEPTDDGGSTDGTVPDVGDDATAAELIASANQLFTEADEALRNGDLAEFQDKFERGAELTARADELLRAGAAEPAGGGQLRRSCSASSASSWRNANPVPGLLVREPLLRVADLVDQPVHVGAVAIARRRPCRRCRGATSRRRRPPARRSGSRARSRST